jgi:hypothetical protein
MEVDKMINNIKKREIKFMIRQNRNGYFICTNVSWSDYDIAKLLNMNIIDYWELLEDKFNAKETLGDMTFKIKKMLKEH